MGLDQVNAPISRSKDAIGVSLSSISNGRYFLYAILRKRPANPLTRAVNGIETWDVPVVPLGFPVVDSLSSSLSHSWTSLSRLATSPARILGPALTHLRSSYGTSSYSPALMRLRSVDACSLPAPRLNVKSAIAAILFGLSEARAGHKPSVERTAASMSC